MYNQPTDFAAWPHCVAAVYATVPGGNNNSGLRRTGARLVSNNDTTLERSPQALVVDDTTDWREILEAPLIEEGLRTTVTDNFESAIDLIASNFYHVAAIDLSLEPGNDRNRDGMIILENIKSLWEPTSTIMVSGVGTMEIGWAAGSNGAISVMEKGKFNAAVYRETVRQGVDRATELLKKIHFTLEELAVSTNSFIMINKMLEALSPDGGYMVLNTLMRRALTNLNPFMYYRSEPDPQIMPEAETVVVRLWSKASGHAILVKLGKRDQIEDEAGENTEHAAAPGAPPGSRLLRAVYENNLGALVYSDPTEVHSSFYRLADLRDFGWQGR